MCILVHNTLSGRCGGMNEEGTFERGEAQLSGRLVREHGGDGAGRVRDTRRGEGRPALAATTLVSKLAPYKVSRALAATTTAFGKDGD